MLLTRRRRDSELGGGRLPATLEKRRRTAQILRPLFRLVTFAVALAFVEMNDEPLEADLTNLRRIP